MVLLRKLRQEQNLSMDKLGKLTGISRYTISNLENGRYKTSKSLINLAKYFNIKNPLDLLKSTDDTIRSKKCLNQRCSLNKKCFCQSNQVNEGAYCQSENEISEPVKTVKLNSTQALFI